jgi:hypothetical protein
VWLKQLHVFQQCHISGAERQLTDRPHHL